MNRSVVFPLIAVWMALAGSAYANCAAGADRQAATLRLLGPFGAGRASASKQAKPMSAAPDDSTNNSIVGVWDALFFTAPNTLFDEGYDQFHSDGTEIMNDIPNPAFGNVCLGVFVQTGSRTYSLHHVFWNFDPSGNLAGRGIWDSSLTLDKGGNSYTGAWTITNFDLAGHKITSGPLAPLSGTVEAERVPAPTVAATQAVANPKNAASTLREFALDGTASTSVDGKSLSYFWSQAQGSLPAAISKGNTANPLVTFGAGRGLYTFVLTVTDSMGGSATDAVSIDFQGI
jgi:hypothetical protein